MCLTVPFRGWGFHGENEELDQGLLGEGAPGDLAAGRPETRVDRKDLGEREVKSKTVAWEKGKLSINQLTIGGK